MNINIQSIHFTADSKLLDFIQKKYDKLDSYYDRITSGEVILKLDKAVNAANKIVEVKLHIPGNILFAKHQCASFEEAVDLTTESLSKQLKKQKEKLKNPNYKEAGEILGLDSDDL